MEFKLNTIEEAIEDFRDGKFVIVVDDEDRENEGDFIMAAEKITPEAVNFMLKNGRGVLCAPITEERCHELQLDMQVHDNTSLLGTPFTVTVDNLLDGCTTGVSMHAPSPTPPPRPTSWDARVTSTRCVPAMAACWCAPATPRLPSTWHVSLVSTPQGHSSRSSTTTAPWHACRSCRR